MNTTRNVLQIIRTLLVQDSTVSALVKARVFTEHTFDPDQATRSMPSVILSVEGGSSMYNAAVQFVGFDMYAYSLISQDQALQVYDKAYAVLQAARLSINNVDTKGLCREVARPVAVYNDQLKAWAVKGSWQAATAG